MNRLCATIILFAVVLETIFASRVGAERELDYATEDAAYEVIKTLSHADFSVQKIAFIPFPEDFDNLSPVFRAELSRLSGPYEFYTRDEEDWDVLVAEIEFAARRGDAMDPATIQKFGRIQGIEAVLFGTIREASVIDGEGIVRFTLTLGIVESGLQSWSGNVEGRYAPAAPIHTSPDMTEVLNRIAVRFSSQLSQDADYLGRLKVYPLTLLNDEVDAASVILPELVRAGGNKIQFYSAASGQRGQRVVRKIARDLSSGTGLPPGEQLERITRQLDQLFVRESLEGEGTEEGYRDAVIYGRVRDYDIGKNVGQTHVDITLQIADLESNRILWGKTLQEKKANRMYWLRLLISWIEQNRATVGALLGIVFLILSFLLVFQISARSWGRGTEVTRKMTSTFFVIVLSSGIAACLAVGAFLLLVERSDAARPPQAEGRNSQNGRNTKKGSPAEAHSLAGEEEWTATEGAGALHEGELTKGGSGLQGGGEVPSAAEGWWTFIDDGGVVYKVEIGPSGLARGFVASDRGYQIISGTWSVEEEGIVIQWENGRVDILTESIEGHKVLRRSTNEDPAVFSARKIPPP